MCCFKKSQMMKARRTSGCSSGSMALNGERSREGQSLDGRDVSSADSLTSKNMLARDLGSLHSSSRDLNVPGSLYSDVRSDELYDMTYDSLSDFLMRNGVRSRSNSAIIRERLSLQIKEDDILASINPEAPISEDPRLANWKRWLADREKLYCKLTTALDRNAASLVMNASEDARYVRDDQTVLQHAINIPTHLDRYRGEPAFFRTPTYLSNRGDPCLPPCSAHMSRAERDIVPDVDYSETPHLIKTEKSIGGVPESPTCKETWMAGSYLAQRKEELKPALDVVEPHKPQMQGIAVEGVSLSRLARDWTEKQRVRATVNVVPLAVETLRNIEEEHTDATASTNEVTLQSCTVCLRVMGKMIPSNAGVQVDGTKQYSFHLTFNGQIGCKMSSSLLLENLGEVKLRYSWRQVKRRSTCIPLPEVDVTLPRYFFDKNSGFIVPGESIRYQFFFRSHIPGLFYETWEMELHPGLDSQILVRLWGMADAPDDGAERRKIDEYLKRRVAQTAADRVIDRVWKLLPPVKQQLAVPYHYFLEKNIFLSKNPHHYYHPLLVKDMHNFFDELVNDQTMKWDFDLKTLRTIILRIPAVRLRESYLKRFNAQSLLLSKPYTLYPIGDKFAVAKSLLGLFVDDMDTKAFQLKVKFGIYLPVEVESDVSLTVPKSGQDAVDVLYARMRPVSGRNAVEKSESWTRRNTKETDAGEGDSLPELLDAEPEEVQYCESEEVTPGVRQAYLSTMHAVTYELLCQAVDQIAANLDSCERLEAQSFPRLPPPQGLPITSIQEDCPGAIMKDSDVTC